MQSRQNACETLEMTPISPVSVAIAPALGDFAGVIRVERLERHLGGNRCNDLARGTTSSMRQPFVVPTSMYSMKRRIWPLPRK